MNKSMRLIRSFLELLWSHIPFSKFPEVSIDHRLRSGEHNCGLVALAKVMPDLSTDQIIQGFSDCCERWPYAGITNKEFNITLRYLGIYTQFEYDDSDEMVVDHFLAKNKGVFILLVRGHFAVVKNGKLYDNSLYAQLHGGKVYCSWRLLTKPPEPNSKQFKT